MDLLEENKIMTVKLKQILLELKKAPMDGGGKGV